MHAQPHSTPSSTHHQTPAAKPTPGPKPSGGAKPVGKGGAARPAPAKPHASHPGHGRRPQPHKPASTNHISAPRYLIDDVEVDAIAFLRFMVRLGGIVQ